ncbi:MAG: hypothetical protein ACP5PT_04575 [Brevinematia bacterium]
MSRFLIVVVAMLLILSSFAVAQENITNSDNTSSSTSDESPKFGFGFSFGTVVINGVTYFQIKGQPDFSFGKLGIGLDINFEFDGDWKLRATEWNSWQAILSKIKYIRWGLKGEKPVYFKIGQIEDATIGNGFIMYNYANNLGYPSVKKFGIAFDLDLDYGGFESFVDNIFDFDIIGLRGFARPLYGSQIFLLDGLEVGASIVADLDPFNPAPPTNSPYSFSDSDVSKGREIYIAGADLGLPIVQLDPVFDMRWYADFAYIFNKGSGEATGLTGSVLSFLPYTFEIRYLQPKFLPSFFDPLYESERYLVVSNTYISKYDLLDNITNSYFGWFFSSGVSFENIVSFSIDLQDSFDDTTYPEMRVKFHLDKEVTKIVAFDFTYDRKNIREFKDIYTTESVDATISSRLYYKVSDMVGIVVNYTRTFGWSEENGVMVLKPLESTTISTEISF